MKKIVGIYNVSNTDAEIFYKDVSNAVEKLQNDGQEVEIKYHVNNFDNGQIVQSALILGRK